MTAPKSFFELLAEGFDRNATFFSKAANGSRVAAGIEQALSDGKCARCREAKATVSIDGKVIFCGPCAKVGAAAVGRIARDAVEQTGIFEGDEGAAMNGFLKGFLGDGK